MYDKDIREFLIQHDFPLFFPLFSFRSIDDRSNKIRNRSLDKVDRENKDERHGARDVRTMNDKG